MEDRKDNGEVVVVGTVHISERSVNEVRETIRDENPDVVAVELDERRYKSIKELSARRNIRYGADMLTAIEEAEKRGVPVALIDRDIRVTIKRFWSRLTTWEKVKFVGSLVAGLAGFGRFSAKEIDVEEVMEDEVVQAMIDEFRDFSPKGAEIIIDERDAYMASKLIEMREEGEKVVAVVGAGHRKGIERYLENPGSVPDVPATVHGKEKVNQTETVKKKPQKKKRKKDRVGTVESKKEEKKRKPFDDKDTHYQEFAFDVAESDDEVVVRIDIPGFKSDEIDAKFVAGKLKIHGERSETRKLKRNGYDEVEKTRSQEAEIEVELPSGINAEHAEAAEADYEKGVLEIRLPKDSSDEVEIGIE